MAMLDPRSRFPRDESEPRQPYLLFARGAPAEVARLMPRGPAEVGPRVPLLQRAAAAAFAETLRGVARQGTETAGEHLKGFAAALSAERRSADAGQEVAPLLSLLVLDGLVAPVLARDAAVLRSQSDSGGGSASVLAISTAGDGPVPFFRACVRPGGPRVAAVFCSGVLHPWAATLDEIFRRRAVQLCLASRDRREEVLAEVPALEQLDRINALRYETPSMELHVYNRLPVVPKGSLADLKEPALRLARALFSAGSGTWRTMTAQLLVGCAASLAEPFRAADGIEAALGVLFHEMVLAWVSAGQLPQPGAYRIKGPQTRVFGGGMIQK